MVVRVPGRTRVLAVVAALATGLGVLAAVSTGPADAAKTAAKTAAATPAATSCGTAVLTKADGSAWTCTFGDDFTASTLDQTKWTPQLTANSGFSNGNACYTANAANVAVSGGVLKLTSRRAFLPSTCKSSSGNFSTRYTSGMVTTYTKFSQLYGRFEMRAKFSTTRLPGVQSSFWMYPVVTDAVWPVNGEIDIAEWYSKYPDLVIPFLHYGTSFLDVTSTNNTCKVTGVGSAWHTYAIEWTPSYISFIYDGKTCLTNTVVAGKYPFNKAYMLALSQLVGTSPNAPNFLTPGTATMQVDYVHGWA